MWRIRQESISTSEKAKDNFKNIITNFMLKYSENIEKGSIAIIGKRTLEVSSGDIDIIMELQADIKTFLYDLENYIFEFNEKTYPATIIEKNGGKIRFFRKIMMEKYNG